MRPSTEDRYRRFALEYAIDLNLKEAAIRSGFAPRGAKTAGTRLFNKPEVQAWIAEELEARAKRIAVDADKTLRELARLAFFDPRKLFNPDGSPKPIHELDDDTAAAISVLDVQEIYEGSGEARRFVGHIRKYRIFDKNAALTNCLKHLGLLKETFTHVGPNGGPVAMTLTPEAAASLTSALQERLRAHST